MQLTQKCRNPRYKFESSWKSSKPWWTECNIDIYENYWNTQYCTVGLQERCLTAHVSCVAEPADWDLDSAETAEVFASAFVLHIFPFPPYDMYLSICQQMTLQTECNICNRQCIRRPVGRIFINYSINGLKGIAKFWFTKVYKIHVMQNISALNSLDGNKICHND